MILRITPRETRLGISGRLIRRKKKDREDCILKRGVSCYNDITPKGALLGAVYGGE